MATPVVTVKMQGYAQVERRLMALPTKVARKVASQAMRAGAKIIQTEAKALAPKDTGALRKSIRVRTAKKKKRGEVKFTVTTSSKDNLFKGDQFYGGFQELGYRLGKRSAEVQRLQRAVRKSRNAGVHSVASAALDSVDKRRRVPGKRFMKRAFNSKGKAAVDLISQQLISGIEREAASG